MIGNTLKADTYREGAEHGARTIAAAAARRKTRRRRLISLARLPIMLSENLQQVDHRYGEAAWSACTLSD